MKRLFILALTALLCTTGKAQLPDAAQAIAILKKDALIVKLIIPTKRIEMLLNQNKKEEALKVQEDTENENKALREAFANTYTFGQVWFVYTPDLNLLYDGDPGVLFDSAGKFATTLPNNWLFIEASESPELGVDGFVVRDRNQDVLTKPFPYFTSQWNELHTRKYTFVQMVEKWQKSLQKLEKRL